jgi:hypothetical protein
MSATDGNRGAGVHEIVIAVHPLVAAQSLCSASA